MGAFCSVLFIVVLLSGLSCSSAFSVQPSTSAGNARRSSWFQTELMATVAPKKKGYDPKWKKKKTLAEELASEGDGDRDRNLADAGLTGNVAVVFKQGNETKMTVATEGELLRNVASQAGQFVKYGCGKGECGTCECLVDGKWIRPCVAIVPSVPQGQEYVVQVKSVKNKSKSSGKFYSVRSFFMGFYNNVLGMVGMVAYRRNAKQNRNERKDYEDMIRQRTLDKKKARAEETKAPAP